MSRTTKKSLFFQNACRQRAAFPHISYEECARLRQQALYWLRADLKAYRQVMEKSAGKDGPAIAQWMQHWLQDDDFAGLHEADPLARLPDAERQQWQKLWQEVEGLRQQATAKPKPPTAKDQPQRKEGSPGKK